MFPFIAPAENIIWTDTLGFDDVYLGPSLIGGIESYTFTHDLKKSGFNPEENRLLNYTLSINLSDDSGWDFSELVYISQPGLLGDKKVEVGADTIKLGSSIFGLVSLNVDGLLEITINRVKGDFLLEESTLNANGVLMEPIQKTNP